MGDSTKRERAFHKRPGNWPEYVDPRASNPSGKCQCNCGGDTLLATNTRIRDGVIEGQPCRFINGHHSRRFKNGYEEVDRGYKTPYWIWTGRIDVMGYGRITATKEHAYAHLAYYTKAYGVIEKGLVVHHLCEQKSCCRPEHLDAITQLEHRHIHMKISLEMREEIRRATGSTRQIALRFGISKSHVATIRMR